MDLFNKKLWAYSAIATNLQAFFSGDSGWQMLGINLFCISLIFIIKTAVGLIRRQNLKSLFSLTSWKDTLSQPHKGITILPPLEAKCWAMKPCGGCGTRIPKNQASFWVKIAPGTTLWPRLNSIIRFVTA